MIRKNFKGYKIKKALNLKTLFSTFIILYLLGGVYLYIYQRSFIYFPTKKIEHNSTVKTFNIEGEKIDVIVLNEDREDAILYFGGRSEAVARNIKQFEKTFANHAVYLLNYRAYGGSSGRPTERNLYHDANFLYKQVAKKHKNISIIGRSLGTGIATKIASTLEVDKLVLVTPYDSILNIAKDKYPFYPISYMLKDRYNSINRVKNIDTPTLIFLASSDETIAAKYSTNLIKEFNPLYLKVKTIPNSGHNSLIGKDEYFKELKSFFKN